MAPGCAPHGALVRSRFTVRIPDGDRTVWFNSATGCSLRLRQDQSRLLDAVLDRACSPGEDPVPGSTRPGDLTLVDHLVRAGFLVPRGHDERRRPHQSYLDARRDRSRLVVAVAPTLSCNLNCSYCLQQGMRRQGRMTSEIQDALVELVDHSAPGLEHLFVQWYGGEPLVALDVIERLTRGFLRLSAQHGFDYQAGMLTNGVLLERGACWRRLRDLRISRLQISLDGLPATYARRKGLPPPRAASFYRFLVRELETMAARLDRIVLRINVDRDNAAEACAVVDLFADSGVTSERLEFRLGRLDDSIEVPGCIPHDCLARREFDDEYARFRTHLRERGFRVFGGPEPLDWFCGVSLRSHLAVDPEGRIGSCQAAVGSSHATFAVLHPGDAARTRREIDVAARPFGDDDPFTSLRCRDCELLPACLGSCPRSADVHGGPCHARQELEREIVTFSRG